MTDAQRYSVAHWGTIVDSDTRPLVFSYGAGLDSFFALVNIMTSTDEPWVGLRARLGAIVHCDLGEELPETTAHLLEVAIPFARRYGFDLTILQPRVIDKHGAFHTRLRTYLLAQAVVPSRTRRWCSQRFKIEPITQWADATFGEGAYDTLLGYDAAEGHRTARLSARQLDRLVLPLMEGSWTRELMTAWLTERRWAVPIKSRCSFCIFSKVAEVGQIGACHPEILEADIELEEAIGAANGRPEFTFLHLPLRTIRASQRTKRGA